MGSDEKEAANINSADVAGTNVSDNRTSAATNGFISLLKTPDYRRKVLHTLWIGWAFVMLGYIAGQRGPSFLDLLIITDMDLKRGSAFFTAGSVGYLVGSMVMGVLYDKVTKPLLMFLSILFSGITVAIIPFCSPYVLMIALCFLNAICLGAVDTGGNADLVRVWGNEGRQYMQAIHFCFSLGGTISPIIIEPFLAPMNYNEAHTENITYNITEIGDNAVSPSSVAPEFTGDGFFTYSYNITNNSNAYSISGMELAEDTNIFIAYTIGAVLTVAASVPFLVMFCKDRTRTKKREPGPEDKNDTRLSKPLFALILSLASLFFMIYCAAEDGFSSYLLSFTVKGLDWTKSHGSQVTAAFWAAFAISRFFGIFFINCLTPGKLLCVCCTALVLSLLAFLLSAHFNIFLGIWISSVCVGLSMSVIFPAAFTWVDDTLFKVTGKLSAVIVSASSAGTMINPIILGFLMQEYTPMWYSYLIFADSILCMGMFLILLVLSRTHVRRQQHATKIEDSKREDINVQTHSLQDGVEITHV